MNAAVLDDEQTVFKILAGTITEFIGISEEMQDGRAKSLKAGIHRDPKMLIDAVEFI